MYYYTVFNNSHVSNNRYSSKFVENFKLYLRPNGVRPHYTGTHFTWTKLPRPIYGIASSVIY